MTCSAALSCGDLQADLRVDRPVGQRPVGLAHARHLRTRLARVGGEELQQRRPQHRGAVVGAGPVVAHRRAFAAQHLGGLAARSSRVHGRPVSASSVASRAQRCRRHPAEADGDRLDASPSASGQRVRRRRRWRCRRTGAWRSCGTRVTGATGAGIRMILISSPGCSSGLPVAGEVVGQRAPRARRRGRRGPAWHSQRQQRRRASPIGEPVPRLPPSVAPLRISREANCGKSSASSGTWPASPRSISDRVRAAAEVDGVVGDLQSAQLARAGRCRCSARRGRAGC